MIGALVALALLGAPPPTEREAIVERHVALEFERVGRAAPRLDPALSRAARLLAGRALATSAADARASRHIVRAVSEAQAHDPSPRAFFIKASPPADAVAAMLAHRDLDDEAASHMGVGVIEKGETAAVVLLLALRRATLDPFPRRFERAGARDKLCGELREELASPDVYVTRPDGAVEKLPAQVKGDRFCAELTFPTAGEHAVEVIGKGPRGPEVAALFDVDVGVRSTSPPSSSDDGPEPTSEDEAREAILERINLLRARAQAQALAADPRLDRVAQAYADRMARENFFAHVSPDGKDLRARLTSAGLTYSLAGENLGLADGPLAAHAGIEQSPGHRKNLLEPNHTHLGVGLATRTTGGRRHTLLVEVLAAPYKPLVDPLGEAYRAIFDRRAALKLPPLTRQPTLERLALAHAKRALAAGEPKTQLGGPPLHEQVFAAVDVAGAAIDLFIANHPAEITQSKNLAIKTHRLVGVGAVRGDSARYGKGKYWVVVVYAQPK